MQMATELTAKLTAKRHGDEADGDRRRCLQLICASALSIWTGNANAHGRAHETRVATAWQSGQGPQVGILTMRDGTWCVSAALDVPSRAHGLVSGTDGSLLAVARRPGNWLMRMDQNARVFKLAMAEPDRSFNGHVLCDATGDTLYTSETDLATGAGLIGVRDARTLHKRDEWPTHGIDPHALLWDEHSAAGSGLIVANGGIDIQPETGRIKLNPERMDSSLVRLRVQDGRLQGQWRLDDRRLSLRHLAWCGRGEQARLGIAMQAEHDDSATRAAAPVLALLTDEGLRPAAMPLPLNGYGGDIAATANGFAVSCPRAHGVALWTADGEWRGMTPLADACPLTSAARGLDWLAGGSAVVLHARDGAAAARLPLTGGLRLDNHWISLP